MKLSDFDFDLPEALIALHPAAQRRAARLLVRDGAKTTLSEFSRIGEFLRPGDLLIFNDTKVIPARLSGRRVRADADAAVEITLIAPETPDKWSALARPAKKCRIGDQIHFDGSLVGTVTEKGADGALTLEFAYDTPDFMAALDRAGTMPLPPYIASKRGAEDSDKDRYQTVFARHDGAIAAPTASLHFDTALIDELAGHGIGHAFVTLHVGIGTFMPVKTDDIADHKMHSEWGHVSAEAAAAINRAKAAGGRIIPVGTTALRLIETVAENTGHMRAWQGDTDIFITPGYDFKITDGLITNFHLPKSTLLMLVSALIGRAEMAEVYATAIAESLRFFSYGDSSLLFPERQTP